MYDTVYSDNVLVGIEDTTTIGLTYYKQLSQNSNISDCCYLINFCTLIIIYT